MKKCCRRKRSAITHLACSQNLFEMSPCLSRAALGLPEDSRKGLWLHNNARKSTKGRSDKVKINQRADPQGLQRGIKELEEQSGFRTGYTFVPQFGAIFNIYFNAVHHLLVANVLPHQGSNTTVRNISLEDQQSRNDKCLFPDWADNVLLQCGFVKQSRLRC